MYGFSATRTVLSRNGVPRLKGVNSLKSSGILSRPRPQSNCALCPYFESISNLCFLISVVGRDRQMESSPNPLSVPSGVAILCRTEFHLVGACIRAPSHGLGVSIFPWGRVTDTGEKESPLPIYDPKVEGG
ncbi:hypothetical protein CRG98_025831 [Punica granatum]|uniref:Uncharacterized protein n=1 Tax=Punica granatum TaxID=22663 RepID=A0A2I0JC21_PUNGR|nr:hypothetical protein CRG98_025831 [Punica granatum]